MEHHFTDQVHIQDDVILPPRLTIAATGCATETIHLRELDEFLKKHAPRGVEKLLLLAKQHTEELQSDFIVGSRVTWKSSSSGYTTQKTGQVVAIVPAGVRPTRGQCSHGGLLNDKLKRLGLDRYSTAKLGGGYGRNHVSYLVLVGNHLYWPRVSALRPARLIDCQTMTGRHTHKEPYMKEVDRVC